MAAIQQPQNQQPLDGNVSYDYQESDTYFLDSNSLQSIKTTIIPNEGDAYEFCGLIVKTILSPEDFLNQIDNIQIINSNYSILNVPKCLLQTVSAIKRCGEYLNVNIDMTPFIGEINMIGLNFHCQNVELNLLNTQNIEEVKFIIKYVFFNSNERVLRFHTKIQSPYQSIVGAKIEEEEPCQEYSFSIDTPNTKGYFIYGNINSLQRVKLVLDGIERWNYSREMLNFIGNRINDNLLYLPHNPRADWKNRDPQTYVGAMMNAPRNHDIELFFQEPQPQVELYTLSHNVFITENGLGYCKFNRGLILLNEIKTNSTQQIQINWEMESKPINPDRAFCPILQDTIPENGKYCECSTCKNCFNFECIKSYLLKSSTCPLCRNVWASNTVYTNKS